MNDTFNQQSPGREDEEAVSPLGVSSGSGNTGAQFYQQSGAYPPVQQEQQEGFFTYEQDEQGLSSAMPSLGSGGFTGVQQAARANTVYPNQPGAGVAPAPARRKPRVPRIVKIILLVLLLVLLIPVAAYAMFFSGGGPMSIRTAPTSPTQHAATPVAHPTTVQATPTPAKPSPTPVATATATTGTGGPTLQVPLPAGWGNRSPLDAENALLEAWTFTQREMRIDFQSVGTQGHPGGTMTGAFFLLTPAAQQRFRGNDKRESAAFFAQVQNTQLIQIPIFDNPPFVSHMQILQAQAQGGAFFVWVNVPFELAIQHGVGGQPKIELNQQTQQPQLHTMQVLLMSVPVGTGPMGGIDYKVSDYALDMQQGTTLAIPAQP